MTFRYSGQLNLSQGAYDNHTGYTRYGPTSLAVSGVPWPFSVGFDSHLQQYYLEWTDATPKQLASASFELKTRQDGVTLLSASLASTSFFPPTRSGRINSGRSSGGYSSVYVNVEMRAAVAYLNDKFDNNKAEDFEQDRIKFASFSSTTLLERTFANVCLRFPRSGKRLWASESFLKQSSPYFQQLLSSTFVEGQTEYGDRQSSSQDLVAYTFDESDEETDKLEVKASKSKNEFDTPFKTVSITDSAYSTYFVVLVWLQGRHISFAPLVSTFRSPEGVVLSPSSRIAKSIYRLSHLLELADLSALALENLKSQLTPSNAAYELYSDVSTCYPAVRDVVLDYVVEHWSEVKSEASMQEMEDKEQAEQLPVDAVSTAMLLARKLTEK
ncbi:hypothetical protein JCM8097_009263 [Rhodosporidiobolus ruineniae]